MYIGVGHQPLRGGGGRRGAVDVSVPVTVTKALLEGIIHLDKTSTLLEGIIHRLDENTPRTSLEFVGFGIFVRPD